MARNRNTHGFTAIRIEGAILPPEFLALIAAQSAKHQSGADYGLTKSLSLKDELARYWRIANDLYTAYVERREREDLSPIRVEVEDWLVPLLKDVLSFDDLTAARPISIGDRQFLVTHQALAGTVPVLLTTRQFELDRADSRFGEEGRRRAPHGLIQEFLNASDNALWGIAANGAKLRVLRDNPSLTRPAYIEADLDLIFEEQLYSDFAALWLTLHASRLKPGDGKPSSSILERWRAQAHETGERALEHLRDGVTESLRQLGNGFLQHPANEGLRAALSDGNLTADGYFQELLRLVYRLLFLFTAEERGLLHAPNATPDQRTIFKDGYSLTRLRDRALKRRHYDRHPDLWQGLLILFRALERGDSGLALPALGGLFDRGHCQQLDARLISNERLLEAIRALVYFRTGAGLARVNYRDMGTEELGSVYESLLELHPTVDVDATPWTFGFVGEANGETTKGSERKLSGSYYTPAPLVDELIKSALEPVMAEAVKANPGNPRKALLDLKIIDPACGSGHFLLAAARRIAAEIARIEAGSDTPDEAARQHALREVVQHCVYGVDRNPLATELCRTALWIETVEPGKPLTFLDNHIRCGDSLVGVFDLSILREGIPEDAYKALTGDDKEVTSYYRKQNRADAKSMPLLASADIAGPPRDLAAAMSALADEAEDDLAAVEAKQRKFESLRSGGLGWRLKNACDIHLAAFFMRKDVRPEIRGRDLVPTTGTLWQYLSGVTVYGPLIAAVSGLASKHRFFHWPLEFPDVMARGGFDVVLGNPPWERIKLQEQEFFAARSPEIAGTTNKSARDRLIKALAHSDARPAEKSLFQSFEEAKREAEAASQFIRTSGRYPLTGVGDVNTYAVFAETFLKLINPRGRAGLIVPTGIATDNSTKAFFEEVSTKGRLASLFDFENKVGIFPSVHRTTKFSLITMGAGIERAEFVFFATNIEQLMDKHRRFTLSPADIVRINPNTKTAPVFRSNADAELTKKIYNHVPVLIDETRGAAGNPWSIGFMRMFDMSNDSGLFQTRRDLEAAGARRDGATWVASNGAVWLPLYEAKMCDLFDHRAASYSSRDDDRGYRVLPEVSLKEHADPDFAPEPYYWIPEEEVDGRLKDYGANRYILGFRDISTPITERSFVATLFPRCGAGNSIPLITFDPPIDATQVAALVANMGSLVFDYVARQKIGRLHFNYFIVKQLAALSPDSIRQVDLDIIVPRMLELVYTSHSMRPFAEALGFDGPPFAWDEDRRARLRAELDAYFAHLYGIARDDLRYLLDPADVYGPDYPSETFRVLKEREIKEYGEYRTQRLVLDAWDRIERGELRGRIVPIAAQAILTAVPDQAWATPSGVSPDNVALFALIDVMRGFGSPVDPEQVRLAAILVRRPALALAFLESGRKADWIRIIGQEARPLPANVVQISQFQRNSVDRPWADAVRQLTATGAVVVDATSGNWSPGPNLPPSSGQEWIIGRASIAVELLDRVELTAAEQNLIAFIRSVEDGSASRAVS